VLCGKEMGGEIASAMQCGGQCQKSAVFQAGGPRGPGRVAERAALIGREKLGEK